MAPKSCNISITTEKDGIAFIKTKTENVSNNDLEKI
jgi:hypothetical protein